MKLPLSGGEAISARGDGRQAASNESIAWTESSTVPPQHSSEPDPSLLESLLAYVGNYKRLLEQVDALAAAMFPHEAGFTARVEWGSTPHLEIAARHGADLDGDGVPDRLACPELIDPWELTLLPVVIDDITAGSHKVAQFLTERGVRSLLAVPLPGQDGEISAMVVLGSSRPGAFAHFSGEQISKFQRFVQLPLAVANEFRKQEELTDTALRLSQLLWKTIHQENGYRRVLHVLLDEALAFSGADAGSLMVVAPESKALYVRAAQGIGSESTADVQLPWGSRSTEDLWNAGSGLRLLDPALSGAESFRAFARHNEFRTYCGLPLHLTDEQPALGLINLYWHEGVQELSRRTLRLLDVLAHAGAEILEYFRMHEELETDRLVMDQFNEHKAILVSLIAHQLRTPLTALKGFSQLMVRRASNGQQIGDVRHAQTMLTEANRLAMMIDNLLELSRLEKGLLEITRRPFDMSAFISDLRNDSFVASLIESGTLSWSIPGRLPNPVGDALRLRQAMLALLRRARTRSPEGAVLQVVIQVGEVEKGELGSSLCLQLVVQSAEVVGDPGNGDPLSMIDLRNVVERQSATQDELALYSAVLLVRAMGGDLRIRSGRNDKTDYVLTLPAADKT